MPIGNGDLAANVWVEPNGDLVFYLSKSDSWSAEQELLKLGRIRVKMNPPLVAEGSSFKQELDLKTGTIRVSSTLDPRHSTPATRHLNFWIDANQNVVNLEAESSEAFTAQVLLEPWRIPGERLYGGAVPDTVLPAEGNAIRWFQRNKSSIFAGTLKNQHLGALVGKYHDPLLNRTFGGVISGEGLQSKDEKALATADPLKKMHLRVHALTAQTETEEEWLSQIEKQRISVEKQPLAEARKAHKAYWAGFWGRSWIYLDGAEKDAPSLIPPNRLNFKIGANPNAGNKFNGDIGRVSILKRALSPDEVGQLAATRQAISGLEDVLFSGEPELYAEIPDSADWTAGADLTVEAWICPVFGGVPDARILDKTMPGSNDGFLLDTHPGNSLRVIFGDRNYGASKCLTNDQWNHVAVTVDGSEGATRVYLNGKPVAGEAAPEEKLDEMSAVTRAYVLQRWIQACAGRGAFPIKFNGSLFTVDGIDLNKEKQEVELGPDYRKWGGCYWFQNTREPYWAMLYSGDYDQMKPLFEMYRDALPLLKERTRTYFGHDGIFCSETMYLWGLNREHDFGAGNPGFYPKNPYIRYYWDSGNELSMMMLDVYAHTQNDDFARNTLIPITDEVVKFYDQHHSRTPEGKVLFSPAMSLETWHAAEDPLPVVVGLKTVLTGLLELPDSLTTEEQRVRWAKFRSELPELPIGEEDGKKWIKPARTYSDCKNSENPELYAVFPYRAYTVGKPDLDVALETWERRRIKQTGGWRQDAIQAAMLGLTDEARRDVTKNATRQCLIKEAVREARFPAFWGPNFDWTPDQCQGSVTMIAFQRMLMQCDGREIRLLPAWPKEWTADFKLHAPYNTTVEGRVENGKVVDLNVTPESRRKDIVQ
jgi:hypothetical protein